MTTSKDHLMLLNRNIEEFLDHLITVDETWIYNKPGTKKSREWVSPGESALKKAKVGLSGNKVKMTVLGMHALNIINNGKAQPLKNIMSTNYRLNDSLNRNLSRKKSKTMQRSVGAYSLVDLAVRDCFLSPYLKK